MQFTEVSDANSTALYLDNALIYFAIINAVVESIDAMVCAALHTGDTQQIQSPSLKLISITFREGCSVI